MRGTVPDANVRARGTEDCGIQARKNHAGQAGSVVRMERVSR